MPSSSSSAAVRAEPALVDHGRTPHAAHYMYDDPRRGHDLENWIIAAPTKPTQAEVIALGVTPDAEYHSGFLRGGVQHWTWIARRPLSDVPCAICGDPAEAIDALAEALRLGPIPPTASSAAGQTETAVSSVQLVERKTDRRNRDVATGRYMHEDFAILCTCGHELGRHTAARVNGRQDCEDCMCESFVKMPKRGKKAGA